MTDEKDAWNSFTETGSILDYLAYKAIQNAKNGGERQEVTDEVQNQGTDIETTEYR